MTLELKPIESRGTTTLVLQRIAGAVRSGQLRVGDRLPSERDLTAQLQVSRQTVRKAIQALVEAEVVEIRPRRGPHGGAYLRSDLIPAELGGGPVVLPDVGEIAGVLEARRLFEPRVAMLAGFLMIGEDERAIHDVLILQQEAGDDVDQIRRLDIRFHLAIARATHNPTVIALMQELMERLDVARYVLPPGPDEVHETLDINVRTLEAIASRDHDRIEATMDEHLHQLEVAWERFSGRTLPRSVPRFLLSPGWRDK